jgi:hypothetical protein
MLARVPPAAGSNRYVMCIGIEPATERMSSTAGNAYSATRST